MAGQKVEVRPVLRVGITGHRSQRLDAAVLERLSTAVEAVLRALTGRGWAERWLVSALADGADQFVSGVGVALGYRLEVILPFGMQEYVADFPAEARLQFATLLTEGGPAQVATLDMGDAGREAAFLEAGRRMLDRSALLIALWDGAPARGPGGTGQIVAEARERGLPVCWINCVGQLRLAGARQAWRVLAPGPGLDEAVFGLWLSDGGGQPA